LIYHALKEEIKKTLLEEINAILRQELAAFRVELQSSLSLPESTHHNTDQETLSVTTSSSL